MKKSILIRIIFCSFAVLTSLNLSAGGVDSDNASTTTNEVRANTDTRNMPTNESTNLAEMNDAEDNNYSWIGLLGLLGLVGFFKKDRSDINKTVTR